MINSNSFSTPQSTHYINSMKSIEDNYNIFLIDMVGVVYNEKEPLKGAIPAINRLLKKGKTLVLLTNNPRPFHIAQNKLEKIGFPKGLNIFTSGDGARIYIHRKYKRKKVFHLGQERNSDILEGLDVEITDSINDCDYILITLFIEEGDDPTIYNNTLFRIASSGKEVICANPDMFAFYGKSIRKTAGYFANLIEQKGGEVTYIGKPNLLIYEELWKKYGFNTQQKSTTLMIGDTLDTDIKGAKAFQIDSFLVLTGNTGHEIKKSGKTKNEYIKQVQDAAPSFVSEAFS